METLRGVAPLLADEQMTTLRALSGPLAGLDVTFGASLVGILVTLSLALVQGDLALAEEGDAGPARRAHPPPAFAGAVAGSREHRRAHPFRDDRAAG